MSGCSTQHSGHHEREYETLKSRKNPKNKGPTPLFSLQPLFC